MNHRFPPAALEAALLAIALLALASSCPSAPPAGPPAGEPVRPPVLKPPPVRAGDTVLIVAPASPGKQSEIEEAAVNLRHQGFKVKIAPQVGERNGYLAGSDQARAAALNEAFADPEARLVLCARGGYGSPRVLDRLDYDLIRRSPKVVMGFSDITALLIAIQNRTGLVTFHGPMAGKDFSGRAGLSPYGAEYLFPLIGGQPFRAEGVFQDWGKGSPHGGEPRRTIAPGAAEGVLTGGNLSTVSALLGTPFEIDARGSILFLEDVNEEPFRIDRMLNQLRLSGKLGAARGFLLGGFTRCTARAPEESFTVEEVLASYLGGLGVPVLAGFPAGHLPEQATLPLGIRVRLDATARTLSLLEPAVSAVEAGGAAAAGSLPGGLQPAGALPPAPPPPGKPTGGR
jgi:muramoyltetrapeptide carboxypeptidase